MPCPPYELPSDGPAAVEDYVASLLLDLVAQRNITAPPAPGRRPLTRQQPLTPQQLESRLLTEWFNNMKTARPPGSGMPRVIDFKIIWDRAFPPRSRELEDLMRKYGM